MHQFKMVSTQPGLVLPVFFASFAFYFQQVYKKYNQKFADKIYLMRDNNHANTQNKASVFVSCMLSLSLSLHIYIYIYILQTIISIVLVCRVFANDLGDQCSIPAQVIPKAKKMVLETSLTLRIIRYLSRVKWSNPVKGVALSLTPWCSS